jgi:predicted RNA binding protein YcfA (HicA-like mRNA interferase family)
MRQTGGHRRYRVTYTSEDGQQSHCDTTVAQHPGNLGAGVIKAIEKQLSPALGKNWLAD